MFGGAHMSNSGVVSITSDLQAHFRRSLLYWVWRKLRERQQLDAFNTVLDRYLNRDFEKKAYSEDLIRKRLEAKRSLRRPFFGEDGRPCIVGFGAQQWERYGLWPTFGRICDFHLFDYGDWLVRHKVVKPSLEIRRRLASDFVAYVDRIDREHTVTCAFFYADTAYVGPEVLKAMAERGIWTVVMGLDDKHRFHEREEFGMRLGQVTIAPIADLIWTTWKTGAEIFLAAGGTPWYAPEAADPEFYHPIEVPRDLEVVFVGQCYGIRADLVRYLWKRGFRVDTFGPGWPRGPVTFEEMVQLYNRAKITLGIGSVMSMEGVKHLKGRDFEVPMSGGLYLTTYNYELADHYIIGKEILCYSSFEECAEIIHWVLRHPDEAEAIRQAGLRRARSDHTWERRLQMMFTLFPKA
jgi:spore maturation protein CgeB